MSAQPSVDWETAGVWAGQLTPAGPTPSRTEATDLVADLRQAAHRARDLALEASGLADALAAPGAIREPAQVLVVDRAGGGQLPGPHTSGLPVDGRLRAHPPTLTGGSGGELTDEGVDRRTRLLLTAAGGGIGQHGEREQAAIGGQQGARQRGDVRQAAGLGPH